LEVQSVPAKFKGTIGVDIRNSVPDWEPFLRVNLYGVMHCVRAVLPHMIEKRYGRKRVLRGVSFKLERRERMTIAGRNGAGKTTLIRSIMGLTPPREGRVLVEGEPIHGRPAHRIARRGLALVPQGRRIFAPLTVRENLLLGARLGGHQGWTLDRVLTLANEVEMLYREDGQQPPVSTIWGLWFLLPIVGPFVWFIPVQRALNEFWAAHGGAA
jgi:ABC-type multidrug transport system fused ATPase/permease subunit